MNRLLCWIVGLWRSFKYGDRWDGCDLVDELVDIPALVTTSKCSICGRYSVSWRAK